MRPKRLHELLVSNGGLRKLTEVAERLECEGGRAPALAGREKLERGRSETARERVAVILKLATMNPGESAVRAGGSNVLAARCEASCGEPEHLLDVPAAD